jgi:hypothetical protein
VRYAVLHHVDVPEPHFDLLVEVDAKRDLWTWRCPQWPVVQGDRLTRLRDHRRLYLDYEGVIAGGRGEVRKVDWGDCAIDPAPGRVTMTLAGRTLRFREVEPGQWDVESIAEAIA